MIDNEHIAKVFRAFCDTNRLTVLKSLQSGEKCTKDLLEQLHIGQPTLSHHMKILCDSGIVTWRKEGRWMHYTLDPAGIRFASDLLLQITATTDSPVHSQD